MRTLAMACWVAAREFGVGNGLANPTERPGCFIWRSLRASKGSSPFLVPGLNTPEPESNELASELQKQKQPASRIRDAPPVSLAG